MSEVETRRFRTWDQDSEASPAVNWRIIFKYGVVRMWQAWHVRLLLILALIYIVVVLGTYSYSLTESGNGPDGEEMVIGAAVNLLPAMVFLLFVAAPLFSEDVRFNAPLFYFSKPVSPRDYILGKGALIGGVLLAASVIPFLLYLLTSLFGAAIAEPLDWQGKQLTGEDLADWHLTTINSVGDWLFVAAVMIPGFIVFLTFVTSIFLLMSAWTERAWHAAIGSVTLLGAWSILGFTMSEISRTAIGDAFGPAGWMQLMIFTPVEAKFGWWQQYYTEVPQGYQNVEVAMLLSYGFVIGSTVLAILGTHWKLRRMEGML